MRRAVLLQRLMQRSQRRVADTSLGKAFDRIGRIDQAAHLLWVLEIGVQVGPILSSGLSDLRVLFVPAFGKGVQRIQRSSLIDCSIDRGLP